MIVSRLARRITTPLIFPNSLKHNSKLMNNKPMYFFSDNEKKNQ
jgi:hypothetical protein